VAQFQHTEGERYPMHRIAAPYPSRATEAEFMRKSFAADNLPWGKFCWVANHVKK
jgi:hypothetical protein